MSESNDKPEGLDEFIKQVFGGADEADDFTSSMEANQMAEAWKGIYEIYQGMRSGGFTFSQANGVMGAYLFHLISSLEGGV